MKHTRRFLVLLLALLILAMNAAPAMAAYIPATYTEKPIIKHNLTLTNSKVLPYNITYTFTVDRTAKVWTASSMVNAGDNRVIGAPSIISTSDSTDDNVITIAAGTYATGSIDSEFEISFAGVSFKEPGVYVWEVTKAKAISGGSETPTNRNETTYIFASVIDDSTATESKLKVSAVNYATNSSLSVKGGPLSDVYPATTVDLTIEKEVEGNLASRDQYFSFTIDIKTPAHAAGQDYALRGNYDSSVPATANNAAVASQPEKVTTAVPSGATDDIATAQVVVWLKHGQNVKVEGLPIDSSYVITEGNNAGYSVDAQVDSTEQTVTWDKSTVKSDYKVKDPSVTANTKVTYENTKSDEVPTGIVLQMAAPLAGIALAGALLAVLLISKKRGAHRA